MTTKRPSQSAYPILAILSFSGCLGYRTPMHDFDAAGNVSLSRDVGTDLHGNDLAADRPANDLAADRPRNDLVADRPANDLAADRPRNDLVADLPRVEVSPDIAHDLSRPDLAPDLVHIDTNPLANCMPGDPYVLILGEDDNLYHFDPSTLALSALGSVACGSAGLNSMTVSTAGAAYISNQSGELCEVDLKTFTAAATPFDPSAASNKSYGMAILLDSAPDGGPVEQTLYISVHTDEDNNLLSRIDLATFELTEVGPVLPKVDQAELTAGPDGTLYGFSIGADSSLLLNIDPQTGSSIDVTTVPKGRGAQGSSYALVYWQGDFYLFLAQKTDLGTPRAEVFTYRKGATAVESIGTLGLGIIGAGVAACQ